MYLVAYPRESQEMVLDAHARAFAFFGGVPQRMIYDNPKTIVDSVYSGKERQFNRRFLALASHYLFEPVACTPASGWEKGQVENQVGNVREWLFTPTPKLTDLAALNTWLEARCRELAQRPHPQWKQQTVADRFAQEQPHLRPVSAGFDGYVEQPVRVSSTCLASHDRNRYSVPAAYAGQRVSLRAYADTIVVVAEGVEVARHARSFARDTLVLDPGTTCPYWNASRVHCVMAHPLCNGSYPPRLPACVSTCSNNPKATAPSLRSCWPCVSTALMWWKQPAPRRWQPGLLSRHHPQPPAPPALATPAEVPDNLRLQLEPLADCSRYDDLREVPHAA